MDNVNMGSKLHQKFSNAVSVIQSLPKSGEYKPSTDTLLVFYSLYKQATIGPCNIPKPWAFDVVAKAKWDAWNKLGNTSKEEAMQMYVDEITKIADILPESIKSNPKFSETLLIIFGDDVHFEGTSTVPIPASLNDCMSESDDEFCDPTNNIKHLQDVTHVEFEHDVESYQDSAAVETKQTSTSRRDSGHSSKEEVFESFPSSAPQSRDELCDNLSVESRDELYDNDARTVPGNQKELESIVRSFPVAVDKNLAPAQENILHLMKKLQSDVNRVLEKVEFLAKIIQNPCERCRCRRSVATHSPNYAEMVRNKYFPGLEWRTVMFMLLWPPFVAFLVKKLKRK